MHERSPSRSRWKGTHHIALTTDDMDATVQFYCGLLDMPLLGGGGANPMHGRHYTFDAGGFHIGFFERPGYEAPAPAPGWSEAFGYVPGSFQHLALALEDESELEMLRERLGSAGVEVTDWLHEGSMRQFLFANNNGIVWEVTWTPDGATDNWDLTDPEPVPAAAKFWKNRTVND